MTGMHKAMVQCRDNIRDVEKFTTYSVNYSNLSVASEISGFIHKHSL